MRVGAAVRASDGRSTGPDRAPAWGAGRVDARPPAGGERNWDYRFTWIRDGALTAASLTTLGFTEDMTDFVTWIGKRYDESDHDGSLQIMYGIDGRKDLTEHTLDHLEGYMRSAPVRIGNGADAPSGSRIAPS